jgi:hypothetical protein
MQFAASLHDSRCALAAARALISQGLQHGPIAADLLDLYSRATLVFTELVGKGMRKNPLHMLSTVPLLFS